MSARRTDLLVTDLLVVGGESDPNTQRVVDQAHLRGLDYLFWDTDRPSACQMAWDLQRPEIDLDDQLICPSAIFLRYNVFGSEEQRSHFCFSLAESFALAWPAIKMLNRTTAGDANNKSRNLALARSFGFEIPETLVLGDLSPLASVPDPSNRIIKPLSGGDHAYVVSDVFKDAQRLASMSPQFVQEKLDGENLRVFSIGGEQFAFHLKTTEVDYRTDDQVEVEHIDVPDSIRDAVDKLVDRIGFDYCALDFRCRNGFEDPVFLEINSFPMFVAFDDACENKLVDAILKYLIGPLPDLKTS